jgi:hypothetical protein
LPTFFLLIEKHIPSTARETLTRITAVRNYQKEEENPSFLRIVVCNLSKIFKNSKKIGSGRGLNPGPLANRALG